MDKDQSLKYVAGADGFSSEGDARSQIHVKLQHIFYKEIPTDSCTNGVFCFTIELPRFEDAVAACVAVNVNRLLGGLRK